MYESIKELRWDTKMLTVKGNDGHEQSNHRLGSDVRRGDVTKTDGRLCIIPSSITYLPAYVKLLVKNGADPNRECNEHLTPTALAIIEDNSEMLTLLISLGADPDRIVELDGEQVTLLQLAVSLYNFKIVRLLLENGADPDKSAPATGETALHVAARARPLERRKLIALQSTLYTLIARGASLETTRNDGFTPLQVAILYRRYDEARILIIGGSRLNSTIERGEFRGRTSFHLAASSLDVDLIDLCLKYGADVNVCDRHDGIDLPASTLMAAIYDFKDKGVDNSEVVVEILKMFTRCNFPVNVIQDFWECVKIFTLKIKSRIVFKMLDSALNTQNDFLIKLMHRDVRCIEKIVAAGAELRCCSLGTPFPLNYIASKGDARIMIILLSGGVQTNRLDESGETALHKAASMGYVDCCRLLLEYGAIYNYKSRHKCHRTPAQLAKFVGHTGVTSLLSTIDRYSKRLQIGKFKQPNPDDELFTAVMNCRSSGGTTLLGSAVHLALKREAEILMGLRLGMSDGDS
ncbi:poly [ADP-ribose] polymerase tankyrase-1-like [Homalodisca vitripennis]|nr:poly [ADP-ribose] polymerase tankyrase-1-like [Homalodisca vitripennis]